MNLARLLAARTEAGRPVRTALIGAGKFGSMFLSQIPTTHGLEVAVIADLAPHRASAACRTVGWDNARIAATAFTDDASAAIARDDVEIVIEATGNPAAGIVHARAAFAAGKHVVMVNVEADALCGPLLAAEARSSRGGLLAGLRRPAGAHRRDWSIGRAPAASRVVCRRQGHQIPARVSHAVTPDGVWRPLRPLTADGSQGAAGMNPQMFNSFLDGTKSAIEMAAIANACDLGVPAAGLGFPPCGADDLPHDAPPAQTRAGCWNGRALVEVVASLERDGRPVFRDLRWGVFVVFEASERLRRRLL